jgi:hypothetical protein
VYVEVVPPAILDHVALSGDDCHWKEMPQPEAAPPVKDKTLVPAGQAGAVAFAVPAAGVPTQLVAQVIVASHPLAFPDPSEVKLKVKLEPEDVIVPGEVPPVYPVPN